MVSDTLPADWPEDSDWTGVLADHFRSPEFQSLIEFVRRERANHRVFPKPEDTFGAFRFTGFANTKVVILGQDPYHGDGQAHGLSFSVQAGTKVPPSLRNIFKELQADIGGQLPSHGNLSHWAQQGVLLLNTVLTVRSGQANSHRKQGWEAFTDVVIQALGRRQEPVVFVLWGKPAERKSKLIFQHHTAIISPHPSPLSAHRGFFGSRPFSQVNRILIDSGQSPIQWLQR